MTDITEGSRGQAATGHRLPKAYNLAQALLNPGDEVIIPAPYWVSYPDMVRLAEGEPVIIRAGVETNFKITPEQLEAAITSKTRIFVINSPSNPTGVAYSKAELAALGEVLKHCPQVLIATDDMYEHILWSKEPFSNILNACPELYERTIVLNGVSKVYAMTGWRIGYAGGPAELIKAFRERHDYVVTALNKIEGVTCLPADGTFYVFPHMQEVIDRLDGVNDDIELAEYLLDEAGIALVPGSAFGAPGYVRISFATSMEILNDALTRLANALTP